MVTPSVTCYYAKGGRGKFVAPAFAQGCGGQYQCGGVWRRGPSAIYGVKDATKPTWDRMRASSQPWWYIDNAYFGRGQFFRITCKDVQIDGEGEPDWQRWRQFNIPIRRWRMSGDHIVVCEQSDAFMRLTCDISRDSWRSKVKAALAASTDRPIIWRSKDDPTPLALALRKCHALVTHTSNSAIEAILLGVPVFVTGPSAARAVAKCGLVGLSDIEQPYLPENIDRWAATLAANQWTLDEIRSGVAWRQLNGDGR